MLNEIYDRFDKLVIWLTNQRRLDEADYVMCNFFIFYKDQEALLRFIEIWEEDIKSDPVA